MDTAIMRLAALAACVLILSGLEPAQAQSAGDGSSPDEIYSLHGQITLIEQYHPAFHSPYRGPNSLDPGSRGDETVTSTFYAGLRLWPGGQFYVDPEVDQGFGLSDTLGLAAFPNGEGSKVGSATPYFRLQQIFFRQTIDLGGDTEAAAAGANQLGMNETRNNIVITIGKFGVTQVFDTNAYAHDPSSDFLNWAIIDSGAYDYAADAWGYSYGSSIEWTEDWWTLRSGFFAMSRIPNGTALQTDFSQFEIVGEAEARLDLFPRTATIKLLGFLNRAHMGSYNDALAFAAATHTTPDTFLVRRYKSKPGFALNIAQPISDDLGVFLRASANNGDEQNYEFTEIDQSVAAGVSLKGTSWTREDDTVGLALVVSELSRAARNYFAGGGLGNLIGDGRLPRYASENVVEAYYNAAVTEWLGATLDYQLFDHPAYNVQRGPVSIIGVRLHAAF